MIFAILSILSVFSTYYIIYNFQYLAEGILWWSIPLIYIGSWIGFFLIFVLFLMFTTIFINKKKIIKPNKFYNFFCYYVAKFVATLYNMKVIVENEELIPEDKKFLLVSNHQSNLDPIAIVGTFKGHQITYIMKDTIMKVPFVGRFLYGAGFIPLDRKNDRKALEVILQGVKRLESGYSIAVYPEGTRSKGPNLNEFRNGIFKVAQKAEAPMLILTVDGFYKVKKRFPFRRTKVLVRICKYIPYEEFKDLQTNEIGELVKNIIETNQEDARKKFKWLR